MIISISGNLGSGKSTVARSLAAKLGYKHYSTGDFWRMLAAKKSLDVYELNKLAESDPRIDQEIDTYSGELGKREDNFVIDSRLAWRFIPHSFKIRLTVAPAEGARRIFAQSQNRGRNSEKKYPDVESVAEANKKRVFSENKRYQELYQVDIANLNNYDLIVDTTDLSPEQAVEKIIESVKTHGREF